MPKPVIPSNHYTFYLERYLDGSCLGLTIPQNIPRDHRITKAEIATMLGGTSVNIWKDDEALESDQKAVVAKVCNFLDQRQMLLLDWALRNAMYDRSSEPSIERERLIAMNLTVMTNNWRISVTDDF